MTTPRVTVPVEPEFTRYRRSQIAHLRPYVAGEALSDRVSISAADLEAGSPKQGDMIARNPANHDDQWLVAADYFAANFEPVSAAPAPEGGADFYTIKAAIERAMMDERDGKPCGCIIEAGCEARGYADPAYAASGFVWAATDAVMQALATREEAPAEAGERGELLQELSDAARWRRLPGNENHLATAALFERAIAALRAQPPAREDAQPVAWRRALSPIEGHFTYSNVGDEGWEPLYDHPAPDALRGAVEAFMPTNIDLTNTNLRDDQVLPCDVTVGELRAISAALQAEQKGGA